MLCSEKENEIINHRKHDKWPIGTIARQLQIHRDTVRRILQKHELIHDGTFISSKKQRTGIADKYIGYIKEILEKHPNICASRIFIMLRERGYEGVSPGYIRKIVSEIRPHKQQEAFFRLLMLPAEQGQVDWADFGTVQIGKAKRKLNAFVMTLSYSRAIYLRFFYSMRMNEFLQGHVEAFEYFEGVPRQILHDNLKTGVSERIGSMVRFNDNFLNFASFYSFAPRAANVRRGNEKGRVERSIQYIRTSFFEGREFTNLDDLNAKAMEWCKQIALERPWPQDKSIKVNHAFLEEKTKLPKLPATQFNCLDIIEVSVGKTPYVRFDGNDYSVPSSHVGTVLELRASEKNIEIFDSNNTFEPVAKHLRTYGKSEVVEDSTHLAELHKRKQAANRHATMHKLSNEIAGVNEFLQQVAERGESLGGAVSSLNRMCNLHGSSVVSQAVSEVLLSGKCNLKSIHFILNRLDSKVIEPKLSFVPLNNKAHFLQTVKHHDLKNYDKITGVTNNESVGN